MITDQIQIQTCRYGRMVLSRSPWLSLVAIFVLHTVLFKANAQCAGSDNSVTVCEKDSDTSTRNYTLFDKLAGTPTPGGTWSTTNPENFFALDQANGIVDLWRINNFGAHEFTYTNDNCGETATVTINLGGFPGEDNIDGSANACGDNPAVNLHQFLGSNVDGRVQDFNGLWEEVPADATGLLNDNFFNAANAGPGVYTFTYTVDAVETCPSRTSTVILEVHPPAISGTPISFEVCADEDLSIYTNVDLRGLLVGEDTNGTWSEGLTNQISDLTDSFINVQEIYGNFGYGEYSFFYTVFPSHPVCTVQSSEVIISILPVLRGAMEIPNFCATEDFTASITYDDTIFPNGDYTLSYSINGGPPLDTPQNSVRLNNGSGSFEIESGAIPLNQPVTLEITGIQHDFRSICARIEIPPTSFLISDPKVNVTEECINVAPTTALDNILDDIGNPFEGTTTVTYQIIDPGGNTLPIFSENVDFVSGNTTLEIPVDALQTSGEYTINFNVANSFDINCQLLTTFNVLPTPDAIDLDLIIDNTCSASSVEVAVNAPILADGQYTVTYEVVELGSGNLLSSNSINFNGGTANYDIDLSTLTQGNYMARIRSTQNDTTPCRTEFDFEVTGNFAIEGIPPPPEASGTQTFCTNDFLPSSPTLENLEVSASGQILFYATATDTDILTLSTTLVDGEDYFVSNIDPDNSCESSERIRITVALTNPGPPSIVDAMPIFCASDGATLNDIPVLAPNNSTITWFDALTGGNSLSSTTPLVDGTSYYAATTLTSSCQSVQRLEIVPMIVALDVPDLLANVLDVCGLNNPTVRELTDLENTVPYLIRWYDQEEGGTFLDDIASLESGLYYAESHDPVFNCTNPNRVAVTVDLSDCIPEDHDFFIPDGFSPNGDGRNDTFFIPNIETIFPDFTLEIFNRYGNSLFKGNRNRPSWDGQTGSTIAPNGVYFYVIDYNKEGYEPIQGRLYLNR